MEGLILQLMDALKGLSYFGIMLALTLEFVPAELVLPLAGYWVYQGDLNLYGAILAGSIGGVLGPLTLYALGRYGGRPMVLKFGKYFLVTEEHINKSDAFFEKYGGGVAFLGRFVPGVRTAVSIPCGMAKMNIWKFIFYTYIAMLPITSIYVYLGFRLGPQWTKAGEMMGQYANFLLLPIALVVFWMILKRRRKPKTA
ncbi:membrane protein DedA with SNARE-associated domain [Planomicrobium soli]|uniref:Membrane protein DedA with SNARE-associated domain n=1 Tax=Planomicrobium soli TaxID=1176648 RepID=A0A2P8H454_9BACL|nr:DedA family protein [Planomicrobium soli]PSL41005.1 membrane protein DedA with SNARE-associated domain [Planomicrobium soli]